MFDDSVSIWPFFHTTQRPPHADVHTIGSPSQNSAGFGGAFGGGTSPRGGGGGGCEIARPAPTPSDAAASPPATANAAKVVLIVGISITPAIGTHTVN